MKSEDHKKQHLQGENTCASEYVRKPQHFSIWILIILAAALFDVNGRLCQTLPKNIKQNAQVVLKWDALLRLVFLCYNECHAGRLSRKCIRNLSWNQTKGLRVKGKIVNGIGIQKSMISEQNAALTFMHPTAEIIHIWQIEDKTWMFPQTSPWPKVSHNHSFILQCYRYSHRVYSLLQGYRIPANCFHPPDTVAGTPKS